MCVKGVVLIVEALCMFEKVLFVEERYGFFIFVLEVLVSFLLSIEDKLFKFFEYKVCG